MLRATDIVKAWSGPVIDEIVLDHGERRRRRGVLKAMGGTEFLLDLAEAPRLEDGDGIWLAAGVVRVRAAPEALMEARTDDPALLARLCWHLGNRHVLVELGPGAVRFRADHVLRDMLLGLGVTVEEIEAPFRPERGAYHPGGHGHG